MKLSSELEEGEEGTKGASVKVVERGSVVDAVVLDVVVGKVVGGGTGESKAVTEKRDLKHAET